MSAFLILAILFGALFAMSYVAKRRFGVLGLALAAGSVLNAAWAASLTPWVQEQGLSISAPPVSTLVSTVLILGPALLLLFGGPTYSSSMQRVVGSLAFAALALMFLIQPIGVALIFDETSARLYAIVSQSSSAIIAAGIMLALGDLLMTRTPHKSSKK